MVKYPDECPVFEYKGEVYLGRPHSFYHAISLVTGTDYVDTMVKPSESDVIRPLTAAARELIAWVKS